MDYIRRFGSQAKAAPGSKPGNAILFEYIPEPIKPPPPKEEEDDSDFESEIAELYEMDYPISDQNDYLTQPNTNPPAKSDSVKNKNKQNDLNSKSNKKLKEVSPLPIIELAKPENKQEKLTTIIQPKNNEQKFNVIDDTVVINVDKSIHQIIPINQYIFISENSDKDSRSEVDDGNFDECKDCETKAGILTSYYVLA